MSPAKQARTDARREHTRQAVAALERNGVCWQQWGRERGFSAAAVKDVCRDRNPATRGELFRVAARIRSEARLLEPACEPEVPGDRTRSLKRCLELCSLVIGRSCAESDPDATEAMDRLADELEGLRGEKWIEG